MEAEIAVEDVYFDHTNSCPECKNSHLVKDYEHGELVCEDCGLVLEDGIIDQGPDWTAYDPLDAKKKARTGAPMTYTIHDKGLSTEIGWANQDINGNPISRRSKTKFHRLRRLNRRTKVSSTSEQNIVHALIELNKITSKMSLPKDVRESAALIYRKAHGKRLTRGRTIAQISAASLYIACRQCNIPRTLDEIANVYDLPKRDVGRAYTCICRSLKIHLRPPTPESYINRFCTELKLQDEAPALVRQLLKKADSKGIVDGKSPLAILGAIIYVASNICRSPRTQSEIAAATGVSEVTIRNRYKELTEALDIHINV